VRCDYPSVNSGPLAQGSVGYGSAVPRFGDSWGSALIGMVNNGLNLAGLDISEKQIIRGLIIIVAVELARRK
jgi:ribose transport system permease protein